MASWTDNPELLTRFNPYVQQQPVEAMVSVGMEKQRRYDEGIQRIQSSIDRVAGLDIMRDIDKSYLKSKLSDLGTKLRTVVAGDFSNYQLVKSVSGMATSVGRDPLIQDSVASTMRARKELGIMEKDRKDGKLDPSNEYVFNKELGNWLNDENVGASFKGSYIPHFDVFEFAKETFNAVKPDGKSFDEIFQMGADGKPLKDKDGNLRLSTYMTTLEQKGLFPEKVKTTIAQIFSDPRVAQQLSISGQYMYRGMNSEALESSILGQKNSMISSYDEAIKKQLLNKGTATTDTEREEIQENIDKLREQKSQIGPMYDSYIDQAYKNPDAVRAALYKDDVTSRYTTMFGHVETSQKIGANPAWRAMFDMQKEANMNSRWYSELKLRDAHHQDRMAIDWAELQFNKDKEALKGLGAGRQFSPDEIPSDLDAFKIFKGRYDEAATNLTATTDDLLWEIIFDNDSTGQYNERLNDLKLREGVDEYNAKGLIIAQEAAREGKSVEEYKTDWLSRAVAKYENMSPAERNSNYILADKYDRYKQAEKAFAIQQGAKKRIDEVALESDGRVGASLLNVKPQTIKLNDGTSVNLDVDDIQDLATYAAGSVGIFIGKNKEQKDKLKDDARKALIRLEERGKGEVAKQFYKDNKDINITEGQVGRKVLGELTDMGGAMSTLVNPLSIFNEKRDWSQVFDMADVMNSKDHSEIMSKQAEIIRRMYSISPPQSAPVLTGDTETDRRYINNIASFAGIYRSGQNSNDSPDFKNFKVDIGTPQNNNFTAHVSMFGDKPKVEIIQYNEKNERQAGMTITPEQARQLNINAYNIFESPEIKNLRHTMTEKGGKTCNGNEKDKETYKRGDYYYRKSEMPKMSNAPNYDAKINIVQSGGLFYPFVYVNNGFDEEVVNLPGHTHLEDMITALKDQISPSFIDNALKEKNGR